MNFRFLNFSLTFDFFALVDTNYKVIIYISGEDPVFGQISDPGSKLTEILKFLLN